MNLFFAVFLSVLLMVDPINSFMTGLICFTIILNSVLYGYILRKGMK